MALVTRAEDTPALNMNDPLFTQIFHLVHDQEFEAERINTLAKSASIADNIFMARATKTGFFKLPLEVRLKIYNLVMHPRCMVRARYLCDEPSEHDHPASFKGSTTPLLLCKQAYREAIGLLHTADILIYLALPVPELWLKHKGQEMQVQDPSLPRFTELQFVSFRRIEIDADFAWCGWFREDRAYAHWQSYMQMRTKIRALAKSLKKSRFIQSVKVNFGTHETLDQAITNTDGPRTNEGAYLLSSEAESTMISLFQPLAEASKSMQFSLYFDSTLPWPPLGQYLTVALLNNWLRSSGALVDPRIESVLNIPSPMWRQDGTWDWPTLAEWEINPAPQSIDTATEPKLVYGNAMLPARMQVPECVRCEEVFGTKDELEAHLAGHSETS